MNEWLDPNTLTFEFERRLYAGVNANYACLVDEEDHVYFQQWLWMPQLNRNKVYFRRASTSRNNGERTSGSIYLHIEICKRAHGAAPTRQRKLVDHWNGNSLDCRRDNLRWATKRQNNQNRFGSHYRQREISQCQT